jgi:predicted  nucleic acid-binding Zn-ribbon protein
MKHCCANCGSTNIEQGESGAPAKCAQCGCQHFATVTRREPEYSVVTYDGSRPELRVITQQSCTKERAKQLFDAIHKAIDSASE